MRSKAGRGAAVASLSLVTVLGVAGCTSDSAPLVNPSGSVSPTTHPATPVFDPVPDAALQHTNDGALAFARFWFEQSLKAYVDPRPGVLARLCQPDNKVCRQLEDSVTDLHDKGEKADMLPGKVDHVQIAQSTTPGTTRVTLYYIQNDYHIVDSKGAVTETVPAGAWVYYVSLVWTDAGWSVARMNEAV